MKVEKSRGSLPAPTVSEGRARAAAVKPADDAQAAGATSVHLGSTAEQMRTMKSSMANTPLVNTAKVAEIRQAISEGRFQVNSGVVADSLIKTVTDLINSQKT